MKKLFENIEGNVFKIIKESTNVYSTDPEGINFLFRSETGEPRELGFGKVSDILRKLISKSGLLRIKRGSARIGGPSGYRVIRQTVIDDRGKPIFYIVTADSEESAQPIRNGEIGPGNLTRPAG